MTTSLDAIAGKLARGDALVGHDALALWESRDLVRLGMLADDVRRRRHADAVTFLRAFDVAAHELAEAVVPQTAGEVRVQATASELDSRFGDLRRLVTRARGVPVTVGALEELQASAGSPAALRGLLDRLRSAGIEAVASAAVDRLVAPDAAVGAVIAAGLGVARFVVAEPEPAGPWDALTRVEAIQRATGAVRAFGPLPRHQASTQSTTGYRDVKVIALSRLVLDIGSIQVDWALCGPKLAQVALLFGADDLDSVSPAVDVGTGRRRAPLEEVQSNIRMASLRPVERDGRFGERPAA